MIQSRVPQGPREGTWSLEDGFFSILLLLCTKRQPRYEPSPSTDAAPASKANTASATVTKCQVVNSSCLQRAFGCQKSGFAQRSTRRLKGPYNTFSCWMRNSTSFVFPVRKTACISPTICKGQVPYVYGRAQLTSRPAVQYMCAIW